MFKAHVSMCNATDKSREWEHGNRENQNYYMLHTHTHTYRWNACKDVIWRWLEFRSTNRFECESGIIRFYKRWTMKKQCSHLKIEYNSIVNRMVKVIVFNQIWTKVRIFLCYFFDTLCGAFMRLFLFILRTFIKPLGLLVSMWMYVCVCVVAPVLNLKEFHFFVVCRTVVGYWLLLPNRMSLLFWRYCIEMPTQHNMHWCRLHVHSHLFFCLFSPKYSLCTA